MVLGCLRLVAPLYLTRNHSGDVTYHQLAEQDDRHISGFVKQLAEQRCVNTVVITTGFLHNESDGIHPEKRLEDVSDRP